MTRAEAVQLLTDALPMLAGRNIVSLDGLDTGVDPVGLGVLFVQTPAGAVLGVEVRVFLPLPAMVAEAESRIRAELRPFEGDCGRGFTPRGALAVGSPGYSASDGWV